MHKKEKLSRTLIKTCHLGSIVIFVLSVLVKFYLANTLSVKNSELKTILVQRSAIEKDILRLEAQNTELSSLKYVEANARVLGFLPMTEKLLSINTSDQPQVAVLPTTR